MTVGSAVCPAGPVREGGPREGAESAGPGRGRGSFFPYTKTDGGGERIVKRRDYGLSAPAPWSSPYRLAWDLRRGLRREAAAAEEEGEVLSETHKCLRDLSAALASHPPSRRVPYRGSRRHRGAVRPLTLKRIVSETR